MSGTVIAFVVIALAIGALVGWLLGSRDGAGARQTVESLRLQLDEVVKERDANREAATRLAALEASQLEREKGFEARIKELIEAKEALSAQFAEISNKLLAEAQETFLKRADQRFRQSEENSGQNLKALLQPVHDRLERYETTVQKVEAERRDAFGLLVRPDRRDAHRHGARVRRGRQAGQRAAQRAQGARPLGRAAASQRARKLRPVRTLRFRDRGQRQGRGGTRLRPDVVVRVPGGQTLVIDAKVSLNDYQDAFGAVDEGERATHLTAHAAAIRAHVNTLGAKAYWSQFEDAPDYVVMFIPGEHFLTAALEQDPTLWDYAFDKKVLLATPTNLIAIARTVAAVWRQERLAKEARQIGELGKELYERLAKAADDLRKVGSGLSTAVNNYNSFVSSFETRSLVTARKFRELNIEPGRRDIEVLTPVEALPRYADEELSLSARRAG